MSRFLDKIKKNLEEQYKSDTSQAFPLLIDKRELDEHGVTPEELLEYVNPKCVVITRYVISEPGNRFFEMGIAEGEVGRVVVIAGHLNRAKKAMWGVYKQEEVLYDDSYFMNQLILLDGTEAVKQKLYLTSEEGPIESEHAP